MSDEKNNYDPSEHEPMPEGEEAPPPLTHTMSIVRWVLLIALSLFAVVMVLHYFGVASPLAAKTEKVTQYHCPMHPTYISNQPGDCPICGMTLVPISDTAKAAMSPKKDEIKQEAPAKNASNDEAAMKTTSGKSNNGKPADKAVSATYSCPMHPEVVSDKPGKCPKCGMNLVQVKSKESAKTEATKDKYICTMCPDVVSDKPGECPKCGMDLVKAEATSSKGSNDAKIVPAKYVCSMCPDVVSDKPGECPKCGMDLIKAISTKSDPPNDPPSDKGSDPQGNNMQNMPGMNMPEETHLDTTSTQAETSDVPGLVPVTIEPQRLQMIGIRTGFARRGDLDGKFSIVGFVTPDESRMKNITVRINGWVLDLFVDKTGQYVKAGQPLLSLYSQDLYQAEQDFMVARDAVKNDTIANGPLSAMRHKMVDAARERLKLLGLGNDEIADIEKSDIPSPQMILRSPFSGYVLNKSVLPGQYLGPDQTLFTVADLSSIWVLGDVYEQDISNIQIGDRATMRLTAFPGEEFDGKIGFLYPSVSEQTRTMKVRIEFANPSMKIRPGMYADVSVEGNAGAGALLVPSDAVLDGGQTQYAFVVHDRNHFEPRLIKTGRSSDDWVEVISGLNDGDEVVTSANFLIDSESRLKAAITGMGSMPGMEGMDNKSAQ